MSSMHSAVDAPLVKCRSSQRICPCKKSTRAFLPFFPMHVSVASCYGGISSPGRNCRRLFRVTCFFAAAVSVNACLIASRRVVPDPAALPDLLAVGAGVELGHVGFNESEDVGDYAVQELD